MNEKTALHMAIEREQQETVQLLLSHQNIKINALYIFKFFFLYHFKNSIISLCLKKIIFFHHIPNR